MNQPTTDAIRNQLQQNFDAVQSEIREVCERAGRSANEVQLVAVTKYTPLETVRQLTTLGQTHLGESRPQQLVERAQNLPQHIEWHLIGHLQRNKVRSLLPVVSMIHSVDSLRVLERIDRVAEELELQPKVLLQVNISGEEAKGGFAPNALEDAWDQVTSCKHVRVQGLMTMAPNTDNENVIRQVFSRLRELRNRLQSGSKKTKLPELSMGMSGDFQIAIEEGATIIRIGSILFKGCESLKR